MAPGRKSVPFRVTLAALPPSCWPVCDVEALRYRLADGSWTLIEFWAPDNLYSRLLAPVRVSLPQTHGSRIRLVCCALDGHDERAAAYGAVALPALVLFHGPRRIRRWFGGVDLSLLRHDIDKALAAVKVSHPQVVEPV